MHFKSKCTNVWENSMVGRRWISCDRTAPLHLSLGYQKSLGYVVPPGVKTKRMNKKQVRVVDRLER